MQRLVSTSEAAEILNLSLQGIHYRIKTNQLQSIKKNGKVFVYIEEKDINTTDNSTQELQNNHNQAISFKNEQIKLLKKVIKWHKKQYKNEIERLQGSQKELKEAFLSEIRLLQDAFSEMKKIYQNQISYIKPNQKITQEYIPLKDFIILLKKYTKENSDVKKIIIDKIKQKDDRFVYDKDKKEIYVNKSYFLDLL